MFAIIGMLATWVFGLAVVFTVPLVIGARISDRRKDDGAAAFASIPCGVASAAVYILASLVFALVT